MPPQPAHATPPMAATAQGRPPRLHGPCGVRKQPFPGTWQQMPTEFQSTAPYQRTLRSQLRARGEMVAFESRGRLPELARGMACADASHHARRHTRIIAPTGPANTEIRVSRSGGRQNRRRRPRQLRASQRRHARRKPRTQHDRRSASPDLLAISSVNSGTDRIPKKVRATSGRIWRRPRVRARGWMTSFSARDPGLPVPPARTRGFGRTSLPLARLWCILRV